MARGTLSRLLRNTAQPALSWWREAAREEELVQQCRASLLVPAAAEKDALEGETQRRIVGLHPD